MSGRAESAMVRWMGEKDVIERRIVLYSHDAMGIGHLRRNLLIAGALAGSDPSTSVLLVAGVSEATSFKLPPRVDVLALPALRKESDRYVSRRISVPPATLIALRTEAIRAALIAFAPDVLVVDKLPRGVAGELEPTLRALRAAGRTRFVLGLRDVLDDPQVVKAEWTRDRYEDALQRYYDAVWVYGDPAVYDTAREYSFTAAVAAKTRYTGYLGRSAATAVPPRGEADPLRTLGLPPGRRLALCMLGGGEDGAAIAHAFVHASLPDDMVAVLLTGPFMPEDVRRTLMQQAGRGTRRRIVEFLPEPCALLRRAERVITMGGYNSVCEVLFAHKRALVVPRVRPRLEQWIRAERLRQLGLLDVLHPDAIDAQSITRYLGAPRIGPQPNPAEEAMDFGGLARLPRLLDELLACPPRRCADAAASVPVDYLNPILPAMLGAGPLADPRQGGFAHADP